MIVEVVGAPLWAAANPSYLHYNLPRSNSTYTHFLSALVARYGPRGTFWRAHPAIRKLPIRSWQIWNEPNLGEYWPKQPFARSYVAMLKAARTTIRRLDPGARIVLAGMPNFVWTALSSIYKIPGARRLFDVVAVHPFTARPSGVLVMLQRVRAVMNRYGDARKPMIITELSWPSALGESKFQYSFDTTEQGQARNIAAVLPMLAAHRAQLRLIGFYYYTWVGSEQSGVPFTFAGLFRYTDDQFVIKPAYQAFVHAALAMECAGQGLTARRTTRLPA